MGAVALLEWVESTAPSVAIREGALLYPIIGGVHLLAIALFGGLLVVSDLRLLGLALRRYAVSEVITGVRVLKRVGFGLVIASGVLLAWGEPLKLYRSPSFWVKMTLLGLVAVHALVFRASVYGNPQRWDASLTLRPRVAALTSLVLWAGLVVSGRQIGFEE